MVTNRGGRGGRDDNAANHKRLELTWLRIVMSRIDHNWRFGFRLSMSQFALALVLA